MLSVYRIPNSELSKLVIVAIGSNLGRSREIIQAVFTHTKFITDQPISQSSIWQTTPVDCPPGSPPFLNAVVSFFPQKKETPESLLEKMLELEKVFGRRPKKVLNEPRPLDLDLIAFGDEVRSTPQLTLPHPRAHLRRFVLAPLNEIAPDLILPGQTKTVAELLAALPAGEVCEKVHW
jgi:2-amino-4-hydroxy-6-hydroxymethyldihydropteridine diphosphokinase